MHQCSSEESRRLVGGNDWYGNVGGTGAVEEDTEMGHLGVGVGWGGVHFLNSHSQHHQDQQKHTLPPPSLPHQ